MADVLKKLVVERAEGLVGLQASLNKGVVQSWQRVGEGAMFVVVREASAEELKAEADAAAAAKKAEEAAAKAEKDAADAAVKAEKEAAAQAAKEAKESAAEAEPDEKKGNGRRRAEA